MTLGGKTMNNIEAERNRLKLTKEEMAKELGITLKTYLSYTSGKAIPATILVNMSKMFNCTVDHLLGIDSDKLSCEDDTKS